MASKPLSRGDGFSYVEALATIIMVGLLMLGLLRILGGTLEAHDLARADHAAFEETRYALERMVRATSRSERLLVPMTENTATGHKESIRDPGVLAMTLNKERDLDTNGIPDADDDADGRFDEDVGKDMTWDNAPGIVGIDDDGDGATDEGGGDDDDESGADDEETLDGIDNDGDGAIDEDLGGDMNGDGRSGIADFDDDGDSLIDEGIPPDDDEDGSTNEDFLNAVVFYQSGSEVIERIPVPWDESGGGLVSGLDFVEQVLVEDVIQFYVERVPAPNGGSPLVAIQITINDGSGQAQTVRTTVKLGSAL